MSSRLGTNPKVRSPLDTQARLGIDKLSLTFWDTADYPFVNHGQIINIDVWDENKGKFSKDDYIGSARVTVGEFLLKGGSMEVELQADGKPLDIYITFKCELID